MWNKLIYTLLFGLLILSSCQDEGFREEISSDKDTKEYKGTLTFDLSTPDVDFRSRTLNMSKGASVLVKNLWIGVFDIETGECFGAKKYDNFNTTMISGSVAKKLIQVNFIADKASIPSAYIVAVANYDDVLTTDNESLSDLLPDYDYRHQINWNSLVNIGIDAESAYAGNKGENEFSNTPFMAGFFQDAVSLTEIPKVDQFSSGSQGSCAIYPSEAATGMNIQLKGSYNDQIYVPAGAICLRRLVSHNIVKLNMKNGCEVKSVKFRRYNLPKAVYMLQRRTDTRQYSNFSEWQKYSPNFADRLLREGNYEKNDRNFPYKDDEDWEEKIINWWDDAGTVEFEFDHFENLHWGFGNLQSQDDREARNADGTFSALCKGSSDAFNDFASYFALKMHVINKLTGESTDVEYTLHEGFCNDEDGNLVTSIEKCRDFSSYRNYRYTYNINIGGFKDLQAGVTSNNGHLNSQEGTIWKMKYSTGEARVAMPIEGGEYNFNGQYMSFSSNPDLGFRIYGRDDKGEIIDVCYNVPDEMLEGFRNLWPSGNPFKTNDLSAINLPSTLLEGMKIKDNGREYNIIEFIRGINDGSISPVNKFSMVFSKYEDTFQGQAGNFIRGLYIFDKNDNYTDSDGCSGYHTAYGSEQYPREKEIVKFDINNILWDNTYYKKVTTVANLYTITTPVFYGAQCSVVDMRWKHDRSFSGYRISVYNDNYTHPMIVVGPDKLDQYLYDVNGEEVFIYPLNTAKFPRSTTTGAFNYSFSITPIVDEEVYATETAHVIHNSDGKDGYCIRLCPTLWSMNKSNDWKTLDLRGKEKGIEVYYRGLSLFLDSSSGIASNFGVPGTQICLAAAGSVDNRYFSFRASVPGYFVVSARSNSNVDDPTRQIIVARMSPNPATGKNYEIMYESHAMTSNKNSAFPYTSEVIPLYNNEPTEFRIYSEGNVQYFQLEFVPAD